MEGKRIYDYYEGSIPQCRELTPGYEYDLGLGLITKFETCGKVTNMQRASFLFYIGKKSIEVHDGNSLNLELNYNNHRYEFSITGHGLGDPHRDCHRDTPQINCVKYTITRWNI
jgi:hypothetical protein